VGEDGHESVLSTGGGDSEFGVSIKGCCGGEEMVIDVERGGGASRLEIYGIMNGGLLPSDIIIQ